LCGDPRTIGRHDKSNAHAIEHRHGRVKYHHGQSQHVHLFDIARNAHGQWRCQFVGLQGTYIQGKGQDTQCANDQDNRPKGTIDIRRPIVMQQTKELARHQSHKKALDLRHWGCAGSSGVVFRGHTHTHKHTEKIDGMNLHGSCQAGFERRQNDTQDGKSRTPKQLK
jgi:hypothetical protein